MDSPRPLPFLTANYQLLATTVPIPRSPKQTGELAELAFMHKAAVLGFIVSKPYGDSAPYDFVVGSGRRLWRVQIKSANHIWQGAYYINTHWRNSFAAQNYSEEEIDFLVGCVPPCDAWYVFPVAAIAHVKSVRLYPHLKRRHGLYEMWRDRWDLLREQP